MADEYIRREDMLNAVEKLDIIPSVDGMGIPTGAEDFRVQFLGTVLKVEPADVVQVRHGRWKYRGVCGIKNNITIRRYKCSECREDIVCNCPYNFCPYCGAKMDGGELDG